MIPNHSSLLLFLSAALVLLAIPGPAVFYVVGRTIGLGRSAGLVSALGIGVGTCVHVATAAIGLSALLMSSAIAFGVVKYLGAAYLIYLGMQKLRREESLGFSGSGTRVSLSRIFGQGIIVNTLNPKTALFFFAFLPQFINPSRGPVAAQILFLGLLFASMGVVSDSLWGLFAVTVADHLPGNSRWSRRQRYFSGGMLISLGLATAVSGHFSRKQALHTAIRGVFANSGVPNCRTTLQFNGGMRPAWSQRRLGWESHLRQKWAEIGRNFTEEARDRVFFDMRQGLNQNEAGRSSAMPKARSNAIPAWVSVPSSNSLPINVMPCGTLRGGENFGSG
jgi:threonine/homoserine/homoserine lactone efflux protein